MRALLFTNLFPSVHEPTRALFNLRRFQALARFCDVRVVVPVPFRKRLNRPRELIATASSVFGGLAVSYPTNWALPRVLPRLHADQMYVSVHSHVRAIEKHFPFDAILAAFAYPDATVGARLAAYFKVPVVALVMGSDINDLAQRPALRGPIAHSLQQAHTVIALTSALKDKVVALGVRETAVVVQRNGVDGSQFTIRDREEARKLVGLPAGLRIAAFVGNLVAEKGPDVLVRALSHLDRTDCHAVFVGFGPMQAELEVTARDLGIADRISFVGRRPADEIPLWLAAADVLCLPSRREGCPNVVLEALASGRPVVACHVGGVPELLSDRNGVVTPPEDPIAFAQGIQKVLELSWDPVKLRTSVPSLTWDQFGRTVHEVLLRAINRPADLCLGLEAGVSHIAGSRSDYFEV